MPKPIQPISERFPAMEEQEITFTFYAPEAMSVGLAGTFNGWHPEANPLERLESGDWAARLMLRSGQYQYRFVADGIWTHDPEAQTSAANPYGELNSVLTVGLEDSTDLL